MATQAAARTIFLVESRGTGQTTLLKVCSLSPARLLGRLPRQLAAQAIRLIRYGIQSLSLRDETPRLQLLQVTQQGPPGDVGSGSELPQRARPRLEQAEKLNPARVGEGRGQPKDGSDRLGLALERRAQGGHQTGSSAWSRRRTGPVADPAAHAAGAEQTAGFQRPQVQTGQRPGVGGGGGPQQRPSGRAGGAAGRASASEWDWRGLGKCARASAEEEHRIA